MKIWKSYGSNHSEDFRIVGKFKTKREAEVVTEELANIIKECFDEGICLGEHIDWEWEPNPVQIRNFVDIVINSGHTPYSIVDFLEMRGGKVKVICWDTSVEEFFE